MRCSGSCVEFKISGESVRRVDPDAADFSICFPVRSAPDPGAWEEDGMANENQLAKTLRQYLADPELLTDENIRKFSRSLRDKGRGMKLHR